MRRRPAQIFALLLVIWIVVVVILPTIDLPSTTLPSRYASSNTTFLFLPVGVLMACSPAIAAATLLHTFREYVVLGSGTLIDLMCSRLC
jgi:hypothetical protein